MTLNKLDNFIKRIESIILSYTIIIITLITGVNVIARYVFGNSITSAEELCMFCIIVCTFIGTSHVTREGLHIYMGAFLDSKALPVRFKKFIIINISIISFLLSFTLVVLGCQYVKINYVTEKLSPSLQIPWYLISLAFPIGFFLMGIIWTRILIINIKNKKNPPRISLEISAGDKS